MFRSGRSHHRGPRTVAKPAQRGTRPRRSSLITIGVIAISVVVAAKVGYDLRVREYARETTGTAAQRQAVFDLLRPVALSNCRLERFGESYDGGYLLCGNLLDDVESVYSYGIAGYDKWGCDLSTRLRVPVHQYDCFDVTRPACPGGTAMFHEECVGDVPTTEDGRAFDTIVNQLAKNGDASKHMVLKMDVEGAEWSTLLSAPDALLQRIDQMAVEFHGVEGDKSAAVVQRLLEFFEVAHIHFNNVTCYSGMDPLRAWAYEVTFVNKRLAKVDPTSRADGVHPLDAPNNPLFPDCQAELR